LIGLSSLAAKGSPPLPPPAITPLRIPQDESPLIDGHLDEAIWEVAPVAGNFVQRDPREGELATEQTEVRIVYTDTALIFGVRCFDSAPELIIARELRRDDILEHDDVFRILLDTYHDHRNGYIFSTNHLGTRMDAIVTDENFNMNIQWDEKWASVGRVDDKGWTVEISIPFKSLRSQNSDVQTWGLNFERIIRRKNEQTYWAGYPRDYNFWTVSQAGHLKQLGKIGAGLRLRVKPYVIGGMSQLPNDDLVSTHLKNTSQVGIEDIKIAITPSITADITVNPDFAQAEVDQAIINMTRFSLFFPEKREFFLEGAGVFDFGAARTGRSHRPPEVLAFYSRRIGLNDADQVPILGGAKITGEMDGFQFGVLNMQTRSQENIAGSNSGVLRVKRRLLKRSYIGGIFTRTTNPSFASPAEVGGANQITGIDGNFVLFDKLTLFGFFAKSESEGKKNNNQAYQGQLRWRSDTLEVNLHRLSVGENFNPATGYIRRNDVTKHFIRLGWRPRPRNMSWIRQYHLTTSHTWFTSHRDFMETRENEVFGGMTLERGDFIGIGARRSYEFLEKPFEVHPDVSIPAGSYEFTQARFFVRGARKGRVSGQLRGSAGQFYNGSVLMADLGPLIKVNSHLSVNVTHSLNKVSLPLGSFTAQAINARINYNFSNRLLTDTTVQYNNVRNEFALNFRLNFIYRPGDDFFIVYNEGRDYTDPRSNFKNRTLLIKLTHSFDI
jgi:hypothetical protein